MTKPFVATFTRCVVLFGITALGVTATAQQSSNGGDPPAASQQQGGLAPAGAGGTDQPNVVKKIDKRHYLWAGPGFVLPRALSTPMPVFPGTAPPGKAVLCLDIGETGQVEEIQVVKSLTKDFDNFAIKTASQWKFAPATKDGKPTPVYLEAEFKQKKVDSKNNAH